VKTTDLPQVTDKLYHIMLYTSPWSRFELTTLVVIGTDYIGSCRSNYNMIVLWNICHDLINVTFNKYITKLYRLQRQHKDKTKGRGTICDVPFLLFIYVYPSPLKTNNYQTVGTFTYKTAHFPCLVQTFQ
jgi:hypothetical protein